MSMYHESLSNTNDRHGFSFPLSRWLAMTISVIGLCLSSCSDAESRNANSEGKRLNNEQPALSSTDHLIDSWPEIATFSILGYDPETGEVGGAVQSRVFCVVNGVLWAEAGKGVVATQAYVDVSYGAQALDHLEQGHSPEEIVNLILDSDPDPFPDRWPKAARQFAVMNASGEYFAHTGERASDWAGHASGDYVTAQGNILTGEEVVNEMVRAFEETEGHLSLRLMAALDAGQAAGGDKRGMQSAAMVVVKEDGGVWLNNDVVLRLQVDDHEEPLEELRRLVEKANQQFRLGR